MFGSQKFIKIIYWSLDSFSWSHHLLPIWTVLVLQLKHLKRPAEALLRVTSIEIVKYEVRFENW